MAVSGPFAAEDAPLEERPLHKPLWLANNVRARPRLRMTNRARAAWLAIAAFGGLSLLALLGPVLAPHNPLLPVGQPFEAPGHGGFLLGSDSIGRDMLSRVLYGMRTSWLSALVVIASGAAVGGVTGLLAGATGGWVDETLMRLTDAFLALPGPVLAIALAAALGPSLPHTLIAVAIVWWPFYARIVRGEVRSLAARPHVEAARVAGANRWRLMTHHLVPGTVPAVVVTASLDVGNLIIMLASLSFLGLGAPEPAPELGAMSARALPYLLQDWWTAVMPALAIFVLAFGANVVGDLARDALNDA
jgi:peptide/nickel transport system permease protein